MKKYILSVSFFLCAVLFLQAASEITANFTLKVTKGSLDITRVNAASYNLIMDNPNVAGLTQNITTNPAGEVITLGNVLTNGVAWFKNLNTNSAFYVEIGVTNGGSFAPLIRLNANEAWPVRVAKDVAPWARATTTGTVDKIVIEKLIFDN